MASATPLPAAAAAMPPPPLLLPGDPAPWFRAATTTTARFNLDTVAGRNVALLFFGRADAAPARAALDAVLGRSSLFDDRRACFFGVTVDPADAASGRIAEQVPGIRYFVDADRAVSRLFGCIGEDGATFRPTWVVLDPLLRVLFTAPIGVTPQVLDRIADLPDPAAQDVPAPVLMVPRVLEPQLCRELIQLYEADGGRESGFMREVDGRTVEVQDTTFKRRRDCTIAPGPLREAVRARLRRRLLPMIGRAFQFEATRIERYIVACYDSGSAGFFRAHRDNTTPGTAHRKFAVTLNLNAEAYDGGELRFPEFGERRWKAPTGGAVVFSCGLLHEATPVTRGTRYACLPFLYDEAGARLREANQHLVDVRE